jgi:arsenate reductase (thioredoxin)
MESTFRELLAPGYCDIINVAINKRMARRTSQMLKVLFLCTGNSCRSQMAEGWARHLRGDRIEAYSAGIEAHGLNPDAVRVMAEAGVDVSGQRSKLVGELAGVKFDYVVTVCDNAREACPVFPGKAKVIHVGFDDPPRLAAGARTEEDRLAAYRRVRDAIRAFVETLPDGLTSPEDE